MSQHIPDPLFRRYLIAFPQQYIQYGLGTHKLREWRDHHRVAPLFADDAHLLEDLIDAVRHFSLCQHGRQIGYHAARHLMDILKGIIFNGGSHGKVLSSRHISEVVGDLCHRLVIHYGIIAEPSQVHRYIFRRWMGGAIGKGQGAHIYDIDAEGHRIETADGGKSRRAVGMHLQRQITDLFLYDRYQRLDAIGGKKSDGILYHDDVGFQFLHHFGGLSGIKFIGVDGTDGVHQGNHDLNTHGFCRSHRVFQIIPVMEGVEDHETFDAVCPAALYPELDDGIGNDIEAGERFASNQCRYGRLRRRFGHQPDPFPGIFPQVSQTGVKVTGAHQLYGRKARIIHNGRNGKHVGRLHPRRPQALRAVSQSGVYKSDIFHFPYSLRTVSSIQRVFIRPSR